MRGVLWGVTIAAAIAYSAAAALFSWWLADYLR